MSVLRVVAMAGFVAFAAAFAALIVAPDWVERNARDQVVGMVRQELTREFPVLASTENLDRVTAFGAALRATVSDLTGRTLAAAPDFLDPIFARLCKYDCLEPDEKTTIATAVLDVLAEGLKRTGLAVDRIIAFVRGRYDGLIAEVVRDLRIFTGANATLFLLAFLALRPHAVGRSGAPAPRRRVAMLLAGTLVATAIAGTVAYFFAQHWLLTILFADYLGYGYLIWVGVIGSMLSDLVFNRGRILGAVAEALP